MRRVAVVVYSHHDVESALLYRCGNDDLLGPSIKVWIQCLGCQPFAGTFENDVHIARLPRHSPGRCFGSETDRMSVHGELAVTRTYLARPAPMHAIEFEQMGRSLGPAFDLIHV